MSKHEKTYKGSTGTYTGPQNYKGKYKSKP